MLCALIFSLKPLLSLLNTDHSMVHIFCLNLLSLSILQLFIYKRTVKRLSSTPDIYCIPVAFFKMCACVHTYLWACVWPYKNTPLTLLLQVTGGIVVPYMVAEGFSFWPHAAPVSLTHSLTHIDIDKQTHRRSLNLTLLLISEIFSVPVRTCTWHFSQAWNPELDSNLSLCSKITPA